MAATNFSAAPRSAATIRTGSRGPESVVSGRVIADVSEDISFWDPDAAPLTSIMGAVRGSRTVTQFQYNWMEKERLPRYATVPAATAAASATVDVATGEYTRFGRDYLVHVPDTGELFLVTATPTTVTLAVSRGIGNSGVGQDIPAGAALQILGPVNADYDTIGALISTQETMFTNYTQIVRRGFGFTGREQNTDMYGGMDPDTEKRAQAIEHKLDMEWLGIFGKPHIRTGSTGFYQTFTGGLLHYIQSNVWDLAGNVPTWAQFCDWAESFFRWGPGGVVHGSSSKYLFASPLWIAYFAKLAYDKIQMQSVENRLGIKIMSVTTPHGDLKIVRQPLFVDAYAGMAIAVDMNLVRKTVHQGRNTKLLDGRQANDLDGALYEWMTDFGMEVRMEAAHGVVRGLGR